MPRYHGGKIRIGQQIADLISEIALTIEDETGARYTGYCEPFVGMAGVLKRIPETDWALRGRARKLRAGDLNESLIKMWKAAQRGWIPPTTCSERRFNELKRNGRSSAEKGFIGHQCGFVGVYFGAFDGNNAVKGGSRRVAETATDELAHVHFSHGPYTQFSRLRGWIIYCDPPYFKSSFYGDESGKIRKFDYDHFYAWAMRMSEDNLVFVSERADLCALLPRGSCELVATFGRDEKLFLLL
jgi:site-specific DNA-adenine methylase